MHDDTPGSDMTSLRMKELRMSLCWKRRTAAIRFNSGADVAKDDVGAGTEMARKIAVDEYGNGTVLMPASAIAGFPFLRIESLRVTGRTSAASEADFAKRVEVVAGRQPARAGPYVETTCCKKALGNDSILVVPVCRDY